MITWLVELFSELWPEGAEWGPDDASYRAGGSGGGY
jgi:hypothetical protein